MISKKQIEANRRNAALSTGPRTEEGKAAVRLNALQHGLRARSVLLPGENVEEYHQLCADLEANWQPRNRTEQLLVEQMAVAQWKLARLEVGERSIFVQGMPAERQMALLDRFSTQRSRLERSFSKAAHDLEHFQKTRSARQAEQDQQDPAPRPLPPAPGDAWQQPAPSLIMAPAPVCVET